MLAVDSDGQLGGELRLLLKGGVFNGSFVAFPLVHHIDWVGVHNLILGLNDPLRSWLLFIFLIEVAVVNSSLLLGTLAVLFIFGELVLLVALLQLGDVFLEFGLHL